MKPRIKNNMGMVALALVLYSPMLQSQSFTEHMRYSSEDHAFWQRKRNDINFVERYHYRRIAQPDALIERLLHLQRNRLDINPIHELNLYHMQRYHKVIERYPEIEQTTEELDSFLHQLPKMDLTSYRVLMFDPSLWHQLQIRSTFTEPGFMQAYTSLHTVYEILDQQPDKLLDNTIPTLIKIDGEQGRMANIIFQDQEGRVMWPQNSHFRVLEKAYDPKKKVYLLHLKDLTPQHHACQ